MTVIRIPASEPDAQKAYVQLCDAMALNDTRAVARATRNLGDLGYEISIYTRHIAKNGDRLEIWSAPAGHGLRVNGEKHFPTLLKYRKILKHLDAHPEDYSKYFFHKNELSPEDYEWMCIDPLRKEKDLTKDTGSKEVMQCRRKNGFYMKRIPLDSMLSRGSRSVVNHLQ
jgi:hypothetical protein